jgi:hypothetical protein
MRDRQAAVSAVERWAIRELVGHQIQGIKWREHDCLFSFSGGLRIRAACPWRIVSDGRLSFAEADDGHQFGLPVPRKGELESNKLLQGKTVEHFLIRPETADLTIAFDDKTLLELWSNSSGYEPWELNNDQGVNVVALGGGGLAIWGIQLRDDDDGSRATGLGRPD